MAEFGTIRRIGNKRIVTLRYTDMELSSRIVRFLHSRGYTLNADFTICEYKGLKNRLTSKIEAIIFDADILKIMAIKQKRIAELALQKAQRLELNFNVIQGQYPKY